jgi:RNA recognition motif-containing protein
VPVRLFIGNLPYTATDDDLRAHFSQVAPPTQVVRPLDRETGRARGFAFIEYAERAHAEEAVKRFDGQLFMGRPIAVSEARAREAGGPPRPAGGYAPRPPGGGFTPRPSGSGEGFSRPGGGFRGGDAGPEVPANRARNFGPPAPPKKKGGKGGFVKKEDKPRGPIPTKHTGRMYALEEEEEEAIDALPDFMKPESDEEGPDDAVETALDGTVDDAEDDDTGDDEKE